MAVGEYFIIKLRVADRIYRLRIKRSEEKKYRDAADAIEKKTNQYRTHFSGIKGERLEEKDCMAMTTIQALAENSALEDRSLLFESRIQLLTEELDAFLKKFI
ncbi:hypothetical protein M2132_000651 [Dysgonomonas sp. PH5-45]|uniref:cell division protein ZapA n=1 Tax=unclassified Dysgonomonas TaxID=2630389 RepID=UPI0024735BBB|nr:MULTISPECIES: cell division protein ZapA [unclassified Dysgonomonas]MDH6354323.1 hypothetical protein [Dysgonomonas sp. PH5-45]MDH6387223.1 hypothetical protein [Dysgonomonas sp. PH5-37]